MAPPKPRASPQTAVPVTPDPEPPPTPSRPPEPPRRDEIEEVIRVARMLGFALSARALLALSLVGAFFLGVMAMNKATWMSLATLVAYSVATVGPIAWLEIGRRK